MAATGSTYCSRGGVYRSPRPPVEFPADPDLSMVRFLLRGACSHPDRLALADAGSGRSLTFRELGPAIHRVAGALSRVGVRKGDVVLVVAPNSLDFPLCVFGVILLGAVATAVNPVYTVRELSKQAADSGARVVVTVPELWPNVRPLGLPTVITGSARLTTPGDGDGTPSVAYLSDLLEAVGDARGFAPPAVHQTDVAALFYSSGTTGANKGVVLTHRNFISAALMVTSDQDRLGQPPHVALCFVPMFHIYGMLGVTYAQLQRGNTVISMPKYEMEAMLRAVERYRVSMLPLVPPVTIALARQGKVARYDLSSLRQIITAAAPIGKEVLEEVASIYPRVDIIQVASESESSHHCRQKGTEFFLKISRRESEKVSF